MKALVTGGAGFIGSNLVKYLLAKGWELRALDDLSTGKMENLAPLADRVEFVEGDIRDVRLMEEVLDGCEVVFHQAALPSVPRSIAEPALSHDVNVNGTLNLLLCARKTRVRRLILASSSSVYGDSEILPRREDLVCRPMSPYAAGKLASENYARAFSAVYGLETVSLRYFNVFGPRQDPDSPYAAVIPRFMNALVSGEAPVIYGDGLQSRDFTFVEHVCQANYLAAVADRPLHGEVCNIGCGQSITVLEVLETLESVMEAGQVEPRFLPPRPGDVKHSLASVEKAGKILGYFPRVDFKTELIQTCHWFEALRKHGA